MSRVPGFLLALLPAWALAQAPTPPVQDSLLDRLVGRLADWRFAEAVVLTSFHQSPLPTALVLRLAGVARITGASVDYPGSLLDVRLRPGEDLPEDLPEPERMTAIAAAAGYPVLDDGRLAVRPPPAVGDLVPDGRYVVLHPGAAAPARTWPPPPERSPVGSLPDSAEPQRQESTTPIPKPSRPEPGRQHRTHRRNACPSWGRPAGWARRSLRRACRCHLCRGRTGSNPETSARRRSLPAPWC